MCKHETFLDGFELRATFEVSSATSGLETVPNCLAPLASGHVVTGARRGGKAALHKEPKRSDILDLLLTSAREDIPERPQGKHPPQCLSGAALTERKSFRA